LSITLSDFNNSFLHQVISNIEVSHSKFNHSSLIASNPTMGCLPLDNSANITDCYFQTAYNEAHSMIELYGYKDFNILRDTIDNVSNTSNTYHGISLHYSGSTEPNNEHTISDNIIYCSFGGCTNDLAGITVYSSIADIQNNYIYLNQIGIQSLSFSRLYITGNSSANSEDQTQRILNNALFQLYASMNAFPLEFHWNSVYGDVSDCFIFHDVDMSLQPPNVNVSNNYWGSAFDSDVNLCPLRHYDYEPIWELEGGQLNISAAQQLFLTGVNQIADSNFTQAKETFQQVIAQYPNEEPAKNSLKEILYLEPLAGNDFEGLKTWYLTDSIIVNSEILTKIAENLANKCDEKLESYPEAIDWYESVIENPESLEDSIFAIIDLEHLYWQMGIDTNLRSVSYVGRLSQFKPESFKAFRVHKDELISLLHLTYSRPSDQLEDQPIKTILADKNNLWNAPNPFKGKTQIHYYLIMESDIQMKIYNSIGQMIYSITEMNKQKGAFKFEFDATDLDSGIYFYQIIVNGTPSNAQKMIVL
jgi:tetratricopeptide (TPR) repeat protein